MMATLGCITIMYQVTIERMSDAKRFRRALEAQTEEQAVRAAYQLLASEGEDYYVIGCERSAAI